MSDRSRVRTDPALIRRALDIADASSGYAAAKELGLHNRTVQRWLIRREREHPGWPTQADIDAWRADEAANAETRAANAAQAYRYRQRVYLNRGPLQLPSLGTTRRLQALAALGWTQDDIAARLGVTSSRVGHLMNGMWPTVFPSTAESVAKVFDALCMVVPTDPAPTRRGEIRIHERTRHHARRRGWLPPLAWDNLDDPTETPTRARDRVRHDSVDEAVIVRVMAGEHLTTTRAEKDEITRRWRDAGRSLRDLERLLGIKPERYARDDDDQAVAS